MSAAALLPARHDEDWRYADADWLAAADPVALGQWRVVAVPAGAVVRETSPIVADGVTRMRVDVGRGGCYQHFAVNAAQAYARLEIEATLDEGARFTFGGVTIGGGKATREFVTRVIHAGPGAASAQVVRAVHWGHAIGNFLGRITVARDAQATDAAQNFKAILLEPGAAANAKPELEILADDVKCAHGAAIGALDESAGFYMAARGIPPEVARRLLVRAFIADAFTALEDAVRQEALLAKALAALAEDRL